VGLSSEEAVGTNAGTQLRADGLVYAAATSDAHILSRRSTDGSILNFRKDTTTVGSIFSGHGGSQVGIGTNTTGITFNPSTRSMMPANPSSTNPQLDATLDIGHPSVRWKDLYLSGTVHAASRINMNNTNGGIFFGTTGTNGGGGFGDNGAIARAGGNGYHISGSQAGDLAIGTERQTSLLFGTTNSSSGGLYKRMEIDQHGAVTMPHQPAFLAVSAVNQLNIPAGGSTVTTVVFGNEKFDQNADFSPSTFTAPVTGKYQFNVHVRLEDVDISAAYYHLHIRSSNEIVAIDIISPKFTTDLTYFVMHGSVLLDMDASDTAYVTMYQNGGAVQTYIDGGNDTAFSGYLVA
jgi:hypothetical protein